jgi:hypothetical protein
MNSIGNLKTMMSTSCHVRFAPILTALTAVLSLWSFAVTAKCLAENESGHPCRYPPGDSWCLQHGNLPYAYRDACLGKDDKLASSGSPNATKGSEHSLTDEQIDNCIDEYVAASRKWAREELGIPDKPISGAELEEYQAKCEREERPAKSNEPVHWPVTKTWWGCDFTILDQQTMDGWLETEAKFGLIVGPVCEKSNDKQVRVTKYVYQESNDTHNFYVDINRCKSIYSVSMNDSTYDTDYYLTPLECEKPAARTATRRNGGSSASSPGGRSLDWVGVDADCTGNCGGPSTLRISLSGGPGIVSDHGAHVTINPGYGGIAGVYSYQVVFGSRADILRREEAGTMCSGSVRVSGTKRNVTIRVYDNCTDAGTGEY